MDVFCPVLGSRLKGLREAVRPVGKPGNAKTCDVSLTVPVNPFWDVAVIVEVPMAPMVRGTLAGLASSVKSGPVTVTLTLVMLETVM